MAARSGYTTIAVNGASAQTTTTASIAASGAISVACVSLTGWPTGALMPVGLNIGESDEEHVWATRSSNTLTVDTADRGSDGTSAAAHASGITVDLIQFAEMSQEANLAVVDTVGKATAAGEILLSDGANSFVALDVSGDAKIPVGNGTTAAMQALSGDVTMANDGAVTIAADSVDNTMLANITRGSVKVGGAADAPTDLVAKTSAQILIGDGTDVVSVAVSGDVTIAADGTVTIAADAVDNTMLANIAQGSVKVGGAANAPTDLDAKTDGQILVGDGTDVNSVAVSGDVTIDNTGAATVNSTADGAVTVPMLTPIFDFNNATGGDYTVNGTSFADIDNALDLSVAAVAGDTLALTVNGLWRNEALGGRLDVEMVTSGTMASGGAAGGVRSWAGSSGQYDNLGGIFYYTVAEGDIAAGVVALRLQGRTSSAGNKTLEASTTNPLQFAVQNIGQ